MKTRIHFDYRQVNAPVELRQLKRAKVTALPGVLRLSQAGSHFSHASFITSSLKEKRNALRALAFTEVISAVQPR